MIRDTPFKQNPKVQTFWKYPSANIGTCLFRQEIYDFVDRKYSKFLFSRQRGQRSEDCIVRKPSFDGAENLKVGMTDFEDKISSESRVDLWSKSKCISENFVVRRELFSGKTQ